MKFVFLFVFVFLLNFETAGLLPHLPLFPIPLPSPLSFALVMLPLVKVPLFAPVETIFIFCSVFCLQYGQYLFVVFGIFILYKNGKRKSFLNITFTCLHSYLSSYSWQNLIVLPELLVCLYIFCKLPSQLIAV
jgi:hypothetical protein